MFQKFLDSISRPAQQIAEGVGKQVGREFQREADRAATRLAKRATKEASRRIVGLFSALAPDEDAEPGPAARTGGGLMPGGLFAPPDDAA